jgi:hypothetical protein
VTACSYASSFGWEGFACFVGDAGAFGFGFILWLRTTDEATVNSSNTIKEVLFIFGLLSRLALNQLRVSN